MRHFHEVGHLHELTFSCYRRMPLLTNDSWRGKLARCVESAGNETAMELVGFVFMPEHVHLLVYPMVPDPSISLYLAGFDCRDFTTSAVMSIDGALKITPAAPRSSTS